MSEQVQRFWSHEARNIRCVREADYDALRAERDALKKDADRYRWIKECEPEEIDIVIENPGDDLDSAIDAALQGEQP